MLRTSSFIVVVLFQITDLAKPALAAADSPTPSHRCVTVLAVGIAAFFSILFLSLAGKTDLLRDGPSPKDAPRLSFSLGRCQMAWWTLIILYSFLYIWAVKGDWKNVITQASLVLMGISSATATGAVLIDSNRNSQRDSLNLEKSDIDVRLTQIALALQKPPANAAELQSERDQKTTRLAEIERQLAALPPPFEKSQGFLRDVLSEDSSVSLHRFQMFVWTGVLGIVFAVHVLRNQAMPDFDALLLTLMGISSGTYIGFKLPDLPK